MDSARVPEPRAGVNQLIEGRLDDYGDIETVIAGHLVITNFAGFLVQIVNRRAVLNTCGGRTVYYERSTAFAKIQHRSLGEAEKCMVPMTGRRLDRDVGAGNQRLERRQIAEAETLSDDPELGMLPQVSFELGFELEFHARACQVLAEID